SEKLFSAGKINVIVTGVRFSENYETFIDLSIENGSMAAVSVNLGAVCLNSWQVDGVLENGANIAAGETRAATVTVNFVDDPNAAYMGIASIAS
ncbi:MAG TPA: hypothetical protein VLM40_11670, partial [Gemmata sp.]|nr:hypothetical protein [Gemmata sp.]